MTCGSISTGHFDLSIMNCSHRGGREPLWPGKGPLPLCPPTRQPQHVKCVACSI